MQLGSPIVQCTEGSRPMALVKHDVFPAHVAVLQADDPALLTEVRSTPSFPPAARYLGTARIVIMNNTVVIAIDGNNGAQVVFREEIKPESFIKNSGSDSYVETVTGKKIAYKKDNACGCGSRLRSWNPYGNVVHSNQNPTE